jgi:hypothetical protein
MVMDHYTEKWEQQKPRTSWTPMGPPTIVTSPAISPDEIKEFRELLDRAREYDKRNNQPDCELESKKQRIRQLAEELGIADQINFI